MSTILGVPKKRILCNKKSHILASSDETYFDEKSHNKIIEYGWVAFILLWRFPETYWSSIFASLESSYVVMAFGEAHSGPLIRVNKTTTNVWASRPFARANKTKFCDLIVYIYRIKTTQSNSMILVSFFSDVVSDEAKHGTLWEAK